MSSIERKLAFQAEQYQPANFAKRQGLSIADARDILRRVGPSREKADEVAEVEKRHKRLRRQVRTIALIPIDAR